MRSDDQAGGRRRRKKEFLRSSFFFVFFLSFCPFSSSVSLGQLPSLSNSMNVDHDNDATLKYPVDIYPGGRQAVPPPLTKVN
jgi:hypothetical protein